MITIASMFRETGRHVARRQSSVAGHTRRVGQAVLGETRFVGREISALVRLEATRWRRFVAVGARTLFAPRAFERRVLVQVDAALRTLDARVRGRLDEVEAVAAPKPARRRARPAPRKGKRRAQRPNGAALLSGATRQ
jgi:hypothetical protein